MMITAFALSARTEETKDSYLKSTRLRRGPSPLSARQQYRPAVGSSRRSACATVPGCAAIVAPGA